MDHFLNCIIKNKEPSPNCNDGLWAMKILEAAYHSDKIGNSVNIN